MERHDGSTTTRSNRLSLRSKVAIERPDARHRRRLALALDVTVILCLALAAEAGHFAQRDGRVLLNGDSAQYIDAAEALLAADGTADFALRKPGYPYVLAAVGRLTGNMTWAPLALNHLLLGLLALVGYGIGRTLHSRPAGWIAAVLIIARLQTFVLGDRVMSEPIFMFFLTTAVLALIMALTSFARSCASANPARSDSASYRSATNDADVCPLPHGRGSDSSARRGSVLFNDRGMSAIVPLCLTAGVLLAAAWLVRGVAVAAIAAGVACIVWTMRRRPKLAVVTSVCLLLPAAAAFVFECSLNQHRHDVFRPSTGSFGLMLMMRARHYQGLDMPSTESTGRCLALLPERAPRDAYRASELDTWVARYRAVHDRGLNEWQTDALIRAGATDTIAAHPLAFFECSSETFIRHLLRLDRIQLDRRVPFDVRLPCIRHVAGKNDPEFESHWWTYWGLPNRTLDDSRRFGDGLLTAATERAPFSSLEPIPTLRYVSMVPEIRNTMVRFSVMGPIWPAIAVLLLLLRPATRAAGKFFTLAYLLDAALISICCPGEIAAARYQTVWLATDSAVTAVLLSVLVLWAWSKTRSLVGRSVPQVVCDSVAGPV